MLHFDIGYGNVRPFFCFQRKRLGSFFVVLSVVELNTHRRNVFVTVVVNPSGETTVRSDIKLLLTVYTEIYVGPITIRCVRRNLQRTLTAIATERQIKSSRPAPFIVVITRMVFIESNAFKRTDFQFLLNVQIGFLLNSLTCAHVYATNYFVSTSLRSGKFTVYNFHCRTIGSSYSHRNGISLTLVVSSRCLRKRNLIVELIRFRSFFYNEIKVNFFRRSHTRYFTTDIRIQILQFFAIIIVLIVEEIVHTIAPVAFFRTGCVTEGNNTCVAFVLNCFGILTLNMVYHNFNPVDFGFSLKALRATPNPRVFGRLIFEHLKIFSTSFVVPFAVRVKHNVRTILHIIVFTFANAAIVADTDIHCRHTSHDTNARFFTDIFRCGLEIVCANTVPTRLVEIERIDCSVINIALYSRLISIPACLPIISQTCAVQFTGYAAAEYAVNGYDCFHTVRFCFRKIN